MRRVNSMARRAIAVGMKGAVIAAALTIENDATSMQLAAVFISRQQYKSDRRLSQRC